MGEVGGLAQQVSQAHDADHCAQRAAAPACLCESAGAAAGLSSPSPYHRVGTALRYDHRDSTTFLFACNSIVPGSETRNISILDFTTLVRWVALWQAVREEVIESDDEEHSWVKRALFTRGSVLAKTLVSSSQKT